mmetsp:Transcript_12868/g.41084  ORF Transcript_12868/g.41084 Transcript_12868/m.41084 type:complete len:308 (-) Transcript_12868:363-1286(-)
MRGATGDAAGAASATGAGAGSTSATATGAPTLARAPACERWRAAELERDSGSESDCEAVDLAPLFVERSVSQAAARVALELAGGVQLDVAQDSGARRAGGDAALAGGLTERMSQTGSVVWDGSVAAAELLAEAAASGEAWVRDARRALELGAGATGLGGLCLAKLAGTRLELVALTDRAPLLERLRGNVARNGLAQDARVQVAEVLWGETRRADWAGTMDLVVAAACVYDAPLVDPLLDTIALYLRPAGGRCLASFDASVGRTAAYAHFLARARARFASVLELPPRDRLPHVRIFALAGLRRIVAQP